MVLLPGEDDWRVALAISFNKLNDYSTNLLRACCWWLTWGQCNASAPV